MMPLALALLLAMPVCAQAQLAYPNKPVRILVGFAPGGGTDIMTRIVAPRLAEKLGQPVIVENRPGVGGNLATEAVVKSPADGYTLLMGTIAALAVNPSLYKDLPFDPVADLTPISMGVSLANVVVVNPALPVATLPELIALAKQQPGKISHSSSGNGTAGHLSGALFEALNDPGIREKLALQGLEPTPSTPEEFAAFLASELTKWAKVVRDTGSKPD